MGRDTNTGATILLVDDVDEYRNMIRRALELKGYRVRTAYDELDAVERAQCVRPDMILLEMGRMPPLQTLDMGCRIRADAKVGNEVKVVVYADREDETIHEGGEVSLGPNEYVILPEDSEQLNGFLGRLLTK
jgi:two-component system OmpR family response regulator